MGDQQSGQDAIFHITHWKAGSMWVHGVFKHLAKDRLVKVKGDQPDLLREALRPGGVYSPVYISKPKFIDLVGDLPHKRFFVIRDLRDTLVSWYFSLRFSHPTGAFAFVADQRHQLESVQTEEGLIGLIQGRLSHMAGIQKSWLDDELIIRYEDMLADEQAVFERICRHVGFNTPDEVRQRVVAFNNFENCTGRKPGEEDQASHRRKGVVGDWRNHFSDRVKDVFKEQFGEHMIATGYEKNLDW